MTNIVDVSSLVIDGVGIIGLVFIGLLTRYGKRALVAVEARLGLQVTDQQNDVLLAKIDTAAGEIETLIDQRAMSVAQVHVANVVIASKARAIINSLPIEAAALGVTQASVATMIVGAVDTGSRVATPVAASTVITNAVSAPLSSTGATPTSDVVTSSVAKTTPTSDVVTSSVAKTTPT